MGCIRVGTLHDFRRVEHKNGIADSMEGQKDVTHWIPHLQVTDPSDPELLKSKDFRSLSEFGAVNVRGKMSFSNVSLTKRIDFPDCFILCSSEDCSKETMKEFEGADSCVEIVVVPEFYDLLTATINDLIPVIFRGIHKVIYQDRQEPWNGRDWGRHPALIKDTKYKRQRELRAIWQPRINQPIKPVIVTNNRMGRLCRPVPI